MEMDLDLAGACNPANPHSILGPETKYLICRCFFRTKVDFSTGCRLYKGRIGAEGSAESMNPSWDVRLVQIQR